MEDKRIRKTKLSIKSAMISLLEEMEYEKITVTQLCKTGNVSRITFYTYYESKNAVIDDMFRDYIDDAHRIYYELQAENNPQMDGIIGYENLFGCMLKMYYKHYDFFTHTDLQRNPYLSSKFVNYVFFYVDDYLTRHKSLISRYPRKQTSALVCMGLFGFVNACISENMTEEDTISLAMSMYRDLLMSSLFERMDH